MSEFKIYFDLGWQHIIDIEGMDHILFILALGALYTLREWRQVLILVTAFTIGHSITLALLVFDILHINKSLVEFLIPVTILITAVSNLFMKESFVNNRKIQTNYFLAIFFGLVHGMAYGSDLKSILMSDNVTTQLLAFNIGLELGQIIIIVIFLTITFLNVNIFGIARRDWRLIISSAIAGIALLLVFEAKFW